MLMVDANVNGASNHTSNKKFGLCYILNNLNKLVKNVVVLCVSLLHNQITFLHFNCLCTSPNNVRYFSTPLPVPDKDWINY